VDVLLTHDLPKGCGPTLGPRFGDCGSLDVRAVLDDCQPRFHFGGHYHVDGRRLPAPRRTESYVLNEVNFRGERRLNPGCFGILRWCGAESSTFEIVDEPWLGEYTRVNFRDL
jgi:hypothetical protein